MIEISESQWQPIETAPLGAKGVSWMMLAYGPKGDQSVSEGMRWGDKFFASGTFHKPCEFGDRPFRFKEIEVFPTHWMPLPSVPEEQ